MLQAQKEVGIYDTLPLYSVLYTVGLHQGQRLLLQIESRVKTTVGFFLDF